MFVFPVPLNCARDKFQCSSHQCIDLSLKCDKKPDCFNGEDERNCDEKGANYVICLVLHRFGKILLEIGFMAEMRTNVR